MMIKDDIIASLNENICKCSAQVETLFKLSTENIGSSALEVYGQIEEQYRLKRILEATIEMIEHPGQYTIVSKQSF